MLGFLFCTEVNGNGGTLRRVPPEIVANEIITKPHARIISPSKTVTSPHKILAKDMEDLIHLQGPLTEDAVMRTLQARFNERKYFVSTNFKGVNYNSVECFLWRCAFVHCILRCSSDSSFCMNATERNDIHSFAFFGECLEIRLNYINRRFDCNYCELTLFLKCNGSAMNWFRQFEEETKTSIHKNPLFCSWKWIWYDFGNASLCLKLKSRKDWD